MKDPDYSFLERLLHRLALNYESVAEMFFDLDQMKVKTDPAAIIPLKHVFVSGLARAGTTVLMRRFHATGQYRSLTYRDMPFVLAPNLWGQLTGLSRRDIALAERAHGDSLLVGADSPESLDEVFWRVFAGEQYLERTRLKPHVPDDEIIRKFVRYVNAILAAQDVRAERYLSKNNNNILRLGAIYRAFPNALVLIPFRSPLQHAHSLLRQHLSFSKMQADRPFMKKYMTWLGHHEFGLDHRHFQFDGGAPPPYPVESLDYWLQVWCDTYTWLARSKPEQALFVCYEDLCVNPATWDRLAQLADATGSTESGETLKLSNQPVKDPFDRALGERAEEIYSGLAELARRQLNPSRHLTMQPG